MEEEVKKVGDLFLVDPNPPGRGKIPEEDLFIYVSLSARSKHRGVGESVAADEGRINFISTEVSKDPDQDVKKSYATTNYTNIGGEASQGSEGMLEGFGITSIQIKYGASLVPQVDISFTDLRGSSLFDVLQVDDSKNLAYGVFFQLPYPIFELELKGYFGNPITYCLHMLSWTSKFDNSTGNFNIDAKFVGFQQAFLADMTLGNVIGTVNTTAGRAALQELTINGEATPTLDNFLISIAKIETAFESLKANDENYNAFKNLTDVEARLSNILDLIGEPMQKYKIGSNTNKPFDEQYNDPDKVTTQGINENNLVRGVDYLSIRDLIIIKEGVSALPAPYFGQFLRTLNKLVNDYNEFLATNKDKLVMDEGELKISDDEYFIIFSSPPPANKNYYPWIGNATTNEYPVGHPFKTVYTLPEKWGDIKTSLQVGPLSDVLQSPSDRNGIFVPFVSITDEYFEGVQKEFTISDESKVFVYDFSVMRQLIKTLLIKVEEKRKTAILKLEKDLDEKLTKEIGFNPNIKYVFSLICNNVQAMLKTLYLQSKLAHDKRKEREKELKNFNGRTDLPMKIGGGDGPKSYPWPSLYVENTTEGTKEERYIGDKKSFPNLTDGIFPEIGFIEEFLENYLIKKAHVRAATKAGAKIARGGKDTDDWYPINPLDYDDNPYFELILENDINTVKEKLSETLCFRALVSKNYSNYGVNSLKQLGALEGISAYKTLFSQDGGKLTITKLINEHNINATQIISYLTWDSTRNPNGILVKNYDDTTKKNVFTLQEPQGVNAEKYRLSGKIISGYRDSDAAFILIGDNENISEMYTNAKTLWPEITDEKNNDFKWLQKTPAEKKNNPVFYKKNYNNLQNLSYEVWSDEINTKLSTDKSNKSKLQFYDIPNISLIDDTFADRKYINILNSYNYSTPSIKSTNGKKLTFAVEKYVTNSKLYKQQTTDLSKALLLLNTIPFNTFKHIVPFLSSYNGNYSSIVLLPKYYLYWIGGTLWRYKESKTGTDPIIWGAKDKTKQFQVPTTNYLYKIGDQSIKPYKKDDREIGDSLINLPTHIKNKFIKYFKDWVTTVGSNDTFKNFENSVTQYTAAATPEKIKSTSDNVRKRLAEGTRMVMAAPTILDPTTFKGGLKITEPELTGFIEGFFSNYKTQNTVYEKESETLTTKTKDVVKDKNIKLSVYNYFKNIYNKWIAGTSSAEDLVYNACGKENQHLIDYFQFINRSWGDIGDKAVINLKSLSSLGTNMDTNIYFLISKILRDNNFLFQILPNYVNFKDENDVKDMFRPKVTLEENSSGPMYVCIYAGGQSESVDIAENKRSYAFPNDSFNIFTKPPAEFLTKKTVNGVTTASTTKEEKESGKSKLRIVAFRVAFGVENQSIFKDVSLDQTEFRETGEYFRVLSDLIDKRSGTQRVFTGTDLLKVFKTRSYKCTVEALGCMSIQPLMYFQLDNVPFFAGTYLITDVNHSVQGNHMTTNFTGLRQSSFTTPLVDKYTTFLGMDFDEVTSEPPPLDNLNDDNLDILQVSVTKELAPLLFNHDLFGKDQMEELGVDEEISTELFTEIPGGQTYFKDILDYFDIKTNAQVSMFLSQVLFNSTNMSKNSITKFNGRGMVTEVEDGDGPDKLLWSNGEIVYLPNTDNQPEWYIKHGYIKKEKTDEEMEAEWIDLFRYRERGYLNLLSKENYKKMQSSLPPLLTNTGFENVSGNIINNPNAIVEDNILSFITAAYIFSNKTLGDSKLPEKYREKFEIDKKFSQGVTSNVLAKSGTAQSYLIITQMLKGEEIPPIGKANKTFKTVLDQLKLLSYTNIL